MTQQKCVLGDITVMHCDTNEGQRLLPRQYIWTSWSPSNQCLELMQRAAEGIKGIVAVQESKLAHTTVVLVLDRKVKDPHAVAMEWVRAFRRFAGHTRGINRDGLVGGTTHLDPATAMATHSEVAPFGVTTG